MKIDKREFTGISACKGKVSGIERIVVNVTDIVNIVYLILGSGLDNNSFANYVDITKTNSGLTLSADGIVGAIQLIISHKRDAVIELSENVFFAKSITRDRISTLILVVPEVGQLFEINSEFEIKIVGVVTA